MKAVVELLSDLVRIPSPSAVSNRAVVDYAVRILDDLGWTARELPYRDPCGVEKVNCIAAPPGQDASTPDADLVFMCHTDTVPYALDWPRALDPFVAGGHLHGCGSCDVKGFLACILAAVSQADPSRLPGGLRIVMTAEEEIGCVGAAHLIAQGALRPRRIIIGEPTSLHPARAGKGYCLAEITVTGREAHSAHPQQGASAILRAARLITAIEELAVSREQYLDSFFDPPTTTVNIGTIQGGTAKNIVPGTCRFELEWRPIPGESPDTFLPEVVTPAVTKATLEILAAGRKRMSQEGPGLKVEITPRRQQPGFATAADAPLVHTLESLTGRPAVSIPFGSEASLFAPLAEEVVVLGPGDMRTAHSPRECVPIAELEEAVACFAALLRGDSAGAA
ncbi:MAG TPA: acetylornithine deacetylase [Acidobacteriaceae bacterium]|jgi:acetylornithine deacetylase|nr:acetylornithine deacetylase [Acidobacteriaceae bacterium]